MGQKLVPGMDQIPGFFKHLLVGIHHKYMVHAVPPLPGRPVIVGDQDTLSQFKH